MTKEKDYLETIEEHRQEVMLEETPKRRTRTKTKKKRNPFLTLLFVVFILFPAGILGYVVFLYEPGAPEVAGEQKEEVVQFEKNNDPKEIAAAADAAAEEEEKKAAEEKAKKDAEAAEAAKIAEEQAKKDAEALAAAEAKAKAEAEAKAKAEAEAQARAAAEAQAKAAAEAKAKEQAQQQLSAGGKTHVVQSNETLYRIAMNYYNSPAGVDKIKQANNLSGESISAGQTLIIP